MVEKMKIKTIIEIELFPNNNMDALPYHIQQEALSIWNEYKGRPNDILKEMTDEINSTDFGRELGVTFTLLE